MTQLPPGSLGMPYVGEALKMLEDPFEFTLSRTRRHGPVWKTRILGDIVVFFAGPKAFSFFMDPAHFTRENGTPRFVQGLLHPDAVPFLDGDRHKARRRLLLAAFTDAALASYLPGIFTVIDRFVQTWAAAGPAAGQGQGQKPGPSTGGPSTGGPSTGGPSTGGPSTGGPSTGGRSTGGPTPGTAVNGDLVQLGFDIADFLFAASDPARSNTAGAADFTAMNKGTFAAPLNLPFTAYGRALRARNRLRTYIKKAVATRSGEGTALGILKAARGPNGEALSAEELEIELLHFFYAAHGGLTAALAWILVVLGQHPDLAAKLRAEADATIAGPHPTVAEISSLALARAVTREVLRAYPIAPITFFGIAKKDLEIDGVWIRAGWKGAGAIWATLQDGSTFQDPTTFDAARLNDGKISALPANAFVPQGGGAHDGHRCVGEKLIQLILPAFVGALTKRYSVVLPAQDLTPGAGGLGPLPKSGLRIALAPR